MKFLHAVIALCAAMLPASAQITNTATIAGWCRSLPLDFTLTGEFARNAGADLGTYSLAWVNLTGPYAISGNLRALHFEGQADYTRNASNVMRFRFTLHNETGTSLVLTGSTAYTVR